MSTASSARAPHAAAAPEIVMFDFLDSSHRDLAHMLVRLRELVQRINDQGLDQIAQVEARVVTDWLDGQARQHHLDEEKHVFPALLNSGQPDLVQQTQRLIQDHGWLEEDWLEIRPQLAAAADGYNWFDPAVLMQGVEVFWELYMDHMRLEESVAYPEAHARIPEADRQRMGGEMAQRRQQREARGK